MPFFQHFHEHSELFRAFAGIHWFEGGFLRANEALFAYTHPMPTGISSFGTTLDEAQKALPTTNDGSERRVFLIRGANRRRGLRNAEAITEILKPYGFEAIDTDNLSLPEQAQLFANCRHLVGIHGAGLTNMIHRRGQPMSLFELHAPPYLIKNFNPCYHNMAVALGYDYGAMQGKDQNPETHNFVVDETIFSERFAAFWVEHGEQSA
jgi:Capsular polysaccharide biosynthesis protein